MVPPGPVKAPGPGPSLTAVRPALLLSRDGHPDRPGLDTGLSHAIVLAAGRGEIGESLRLHTPADIVAFGRQDVVAPGFPEAVAAARRAGFTPVERLAGGRAAVFTPGTLAFAWAIPATDPRAGIEDRFAALAGIMATAFRSLGVDARVGEVPGEYCPGRHSVNARGRVKLMGVGQRLVRGAAHVGGVVVVEEAGRVRNVLVPVYRALGIEWDPSTVGDLAGEAPGVTVDDAAGAILAAFAERADLTPWSVPAALLEEGAGLADRHLA